MNKIILTISLIILFSFPLMSQDKEFFIQSESKYSLEKTIAMIKENASVKGWKVPIVHELHKSVAKAGYEVLPVHVVEVCNPKLAGQVLEKNHLRFMTVLMPIRFSVYLNEEGSVFISRMNSEIIGSLLDGEDKELVMKSCSSADEILKGVIK